MTGRPSCAAAVAGPLQALLTDVLIYCLKNDFCSALPLRHLFLFRMTEAFQTVLAVPPPAPALFKRQPRCLHYPLRPGKDLLQAGWTYF